MVGRLKEQVQYHWVNRTDIANICLGVPALYILWPIQDASVNITVFGSIGLFAIAVRMSHTLSLRPSIPFTLLRSTLPWFEPILTMEREITSKVNHDFRTSLRLQQLFGNRIKIEGPFRVSHYEANGFPEKSMMYFVSGDGCEDGSWVSLKASFYREEVDRETGEMKQVNFDPAIEGFSGEWSIRISDTRMRFHVNRRGFKINLNDFTSEAAFSLILDQDIPSDKDKKKTGQDSTQQ
jgi:hypothetical protein